VTAVAFTPNSKQLVTLAGTEVKTWDARSLELKTTFAHKEHDVGRLMALALSPDGKTVLTGGSGAIFGLRVEQPGWIWHWEASGEYRDLIPHQGGAGEVISLAFSRDGKWLASGSQPGHVQLWDWEKRKPARGWPAHGGPTWAVAFSPDGRTLATGGHDHAVRLWDVATGKLLRSLPEHDHLVLSLDFSPDGKLLATGSYDQCLRLFDPATGALLQKEPLGGWVQSVRFSPDGLTLASGERGGKVRMWRVGPR
jgi:WD40 repeat protein